MRGGEKRKKLGKTGDCKTFNGKTKRRKSEIENYQGGNEEHVFKTGLQAPCVAE